MAKKTNDIEKIIKHFEKSFEITGKGKGALNDKFKEISTDVLYLLAKQYEAAIDAFYEDRYPKVYERTGTILQASSASKFVNRVNKGFSYNELGTEKRFPRYQLNNGVVEINKETKGYRLIESSNLNKSNIKTGFTATIEISPDYIKNKYETHPRGSFSTEDIYKNTFEDGVHVLPNQPNVKMAKPPVKIMTELIKSSEFESELNNIIKKHGFKKMKRIK